MEEKFLKVSNSVFLKAGCMGMLFQQNARDEVAWNVGIIAPPVYRMRMDYCARLVSLT